MTTLPEVIDKLYGTQSYLIKNIISYAQNPIHFHAKKIVESKKFILKNISYFNLLILLSCEINIMNVKMAFEQANEKSMRSFLKKYASGHYKYALYQLIGEEKSN